MTELFERVAATATTMWAGMTSWFGVLLDCEMCGALSNESCVALPDGRVCPGMEDS